ncbi:unnamed protein product, partial [Mesorhabditis spiculigera]
MSASQEDEVKRGPGRPRVFKVEQRPGESFDAAVKRQANDRHRLSVKQRLINMRALVDELLTLEIHHEKWMEVVPLIEKLQSMRPGTRVPKKKAEYLPSNPARKRAQGAEAIRTFRQRQKEEVKYFWDVMILNIRPILLETSGAEILQLAQKYGVQFDL